MLTRTRFFSVFTFALILFSACKRTEGTKEYIGPADITTPLNFSVNGNGLSAKYSLVNFISQTQFFHSVFSHTVAWNLEIRGTHSGAVRFYSGISKTLDSSNTAFDGKADSLRFFLPGETCAVRLKIAGWAKEYSSSFAINQMPSFNCTLLDDFESPYDSIGFCMLYTDPTDSLVMFKEGETDVVFEGRKSMKINGFDSNDNYWISSLSTKNLNIKTMLAGKEASSTYLNLFAKGLTNGKAILELQLQEDENNDGVFNSSNDELWKGKATLSGDWQKISLALGSFEKSGTIGNGTIEPGKILRIALVLISYPPGDYTETYVDYVNFTFGAPFSQK